MWNGSARMTSPRDERKVSMGISVILLSLAIIRYRIKPSTFFVTRVVKLPRWWFNKNDFKTLSTLPSFALCWKFDDASLRPSAFSFNAQPLNQWKHSPCLGELKRLISIHIVKSIVSFIASFLALSALYCRRHPPWNIKKAKDKSRATRFFSC